MTKQEFLEQLSRALSSRVDSFTVNENLSYYEEYIATQVRMGNSEEDVVKALGDPRLLARTIEEAQKRAGRVDIDEYSEVREHHDDENQKSGMPSWLKIFLVCFVGVVVLLVLGRLFIGFLPIILVVYFLYIIHKRL